ncbi:adenylosuccinate synthetase [Pedobacter sp. G11]|uniref:adenylosuccinate synthetase n=1 Tax=Pedobacter sp. G11 TaxID=2482728 RepID=UPI00143CCC09|nr:adenylosuccinate synthetase [Pedobacter sp. G11]
MVERRALVIVGLGYGDEGKGLATDFFCLNHPESIVIRFNGGQQAGHCVINKEGEKHIFSNLGSGTFRGIPTFWSKYCTFSPLLFVEECQKLNKSFKFYIDPNCPITTHYDILFNRASEITLGKARKGSCGVGFSTTIEREQSGLSLLLSDLFDNQVLVEKLTQIKKYYRHKINLDTAFDFDSMDHDYEDTLFLNSILDIQKFLYSNAVQMICESDLFKTMVSKTLIFEGSQGILLDQHFGKWPHVTMSNTSSQNAMEMISRYCSGYTTEVVYITRAYRTRHGSGPFPEQHKDFRLLEQNIDETNETNCYQGALRFDFLDLDVLNDAVAFDEQFSAGLGKNLLVTCMDHLEDDKIRAFTNKDLCSFQYTEIWKYLNFPIKKLIFSFGNCAESLFDAKKNHEIGTNVYISSN